MENLASDQMPFFGRCFCVTIAKNSDLVQEEHCAHVYILAFGYGGNKGGLEVNRAASKLTQKMPSLFPKEKRQKKNELYLFHSGTAMINRPFYSDLAFEWQRGCR